MPTVPLAVLALVMTGAAGVVGAIVIDNVAMPVPLVFVAEIVTLVVPAAVGVPEIAPVVVFNVRPGGSPAAPKLVGLLVAVMA